MVSFVILSIGAYALDLLKGMFEDKVDVLPILIAIIVWMLVTLLKVVELVNWIVYLILVLLVVGGYFLYEKVLNNKISLADGETNQENYVQNVNIPSQQPGVEEKKFDPRDLFKEDNENKPALVDRGINNQNNGNPFMGIDPKNSTFENAFKDDNNNRF